MKKKFIAVLLAVMAVSITACGQTANNTDNGEEIAELKEEIEALKEENAELRAKLEATDTSSPEQSDEESSELDDFVAETSGVCGADLTWEYGNGILRIHGTGDMTDYDYDNVPWEDVKGRVGHIYIEEGVTSVGTHAFGNMEIASKIVIPSSVSSLRCESFFAAEAAALPYDETRSEEDSRKMIEQQEKSILEVNLPSFQMLIWGSKTYSSLNELYDAMEH